MENSRQDPDISDIPEAVAERRRRSSIQLVWIIPIIAALIGGTLAVRSCTQRGRTFTVSFKTGEGVEADKTKIKYKEVEIGQVKEVTIAEDRAHVVVTAELHKKAEGFLVEDTRFWVVRPRISGGNVSGLSTLLGGAYIGVDVGKSKKPQRHFQGLEVAPVVTMDVPGTMFVLRAADLGSLSTGSPLFFRRLQVGQVVAFELDKAGKGVTLAVFINAPYDQYVKENTLFWHASGIDLRVNANGLRLNTESMVSVLVGGIAFQTPEESGEAPQAGPNTVFPLFPSREEAMKRAGFAETFLLLFKESVRGLSVGAPVEFGGITVGEVTRMDLDLKPGRKGFNVPVEVRLYPEHLRSRRIGGAKEPGDPDRYLNELVEQGLRAQLKSGNLLTGQLYIGLDFFPHAAKAKIDRTRRPPEFPVTRARQEELQATLTRLAGKLEKVPVKEIAAEVRQAVRTFDHTLGNADRLVRRLDTEVVPEARATLEEAHRTLDAAKQTLSSDTPLQQDLRETLHELGRSARAVRELADYLERNPEALIRGKKED